MGERRKKRGLLAGLIGGAVAGATVALLLAPKTGRQSRKLVTLGVGKAARKVKRIRGKGGADQG